MYIICRSTCITRPNKLGTKPKYNKFKDTFVNAFNDIKLVKDYLKECIIEKNIDIVDMHPETREGLQRKYPEKFLNNVALFVMANVYGHITTYNIYYIYATTDSALFEDPVYMNVKEENIKEDLIKFYNKIKEMKENGDVDKQARDS